ncbi:MAG: cobyric acid synthase [Parvibaculales bacterium]
MTRRNEAEGMSVPAHALMLQGTGSDVGKTVLVAGLCRLARRRGIKVAPFKPQNMSNNAAVCPDGGEIGRAQALQARAAGLPPHTDFNPVLLKPQSDTAAQVIVHGKVRQAAEAADYMSGRGALLTPVLESFQRLTTAYDLILVEGAGSPAEVNLRHGDIANMGFARAAGVPVCLVGDIDRGGVIAALCGTQSVLKRDDPEDAALIKSFLVNKFRGDVSLFEAGVNVIEEMTGWPCMGVVPWLACVSRLPAEDAIPANTPAPAGRAKCLKIVAPMMSRMANFDDADPLRQEDDVDFQFIPPGTPLPPDADCVILFGTKSSLSDMAFFRQQGWHHDVQAHVRRGGHVLGLCGGYQMLGRSLIDPDGVDGMAGAMEGLGLLDVETVMHTNKQTRQVEAVHAATGLPIQAYEIHAGVTDGPDCDRPFSLLADGQTDGAMRADRRVSGTYLHGLFAKDAFRRSWLAGLTAQSAPNAANDAANDAALGYAETVDRALDELADGLEQALDVEALFAHAAPPFQAF